MLQMIVNIKHIKEGMQKLSALSCRAYKKILRNAFLEIMTESMCLQNMYNKPMLCVCQCML